MVTKIYKASASWCGPCRQVAKELEDFDLVPIEEVDIEESDEFCEKYKIRSIPTLIFMDNDKELFRHVGSISKQEVINKINELNGTN